MLATCRVVANAIWGGTVSGKQGVYLPPGLRNRNNAQMDTTDNVVRVFKDNGWFNPSGGGDLYLNPWGTSQHPHFHMRVNGYHITKNEDVRNAILFLSWSTGEQASGVPAWKLYDRNAHIFDKDWERGYQRIAGMRASSVTQAKDWVFDEIGKIMDYLHKNR